MSNKKDSDQSGTADTRKNAAGSQGEGFAAKVDRLSQNTSATGASESPESTNGHRDDTSDADTAHEPVLITESLPESGHAPVKIIKKRSLAGLLGLLFGAAALGGLGYWYYLQNGWHWPPVGTARVKHADLRALEKRLRDDFNNQLKQISEQLAQNAVPSGNASTSAADTTVLTEQIHTLQTRLDELQQQLQSLPQGQSTANQLAETNSADVNEQLAALQNQLQQASEQIQALQIALAESRETTQAQLAHWQQQLEAALAEGPARTADASGLPVNPQTAQDLSRQLYLQQALNALTSARLALDVQQRPQAAAVALQQAAEALDAAKATTEAQAVRDALTQLQRSSAQADPSPATLTETMQAISQWHWQPPAQATNNTGNKKDSWLGKLIVIKKIDQPQQAAMTLAEETALKNQVLDALNAAALAQQNGDQARWQQQLNRAIQRLQPYAETQPTLAAAINTLETLRQHSVTPHWPDLEPIRQAVEKAMNRTERPDNAENKENENTENSGNSPT